MRLRIGASTPIPTTRPRAGCLQGGIEKRHACRIWEPLVPSRAKSHGCVNLGRACTILESRFQITNALVIQIGHACPIWKIRFPFGARGHHRGKVAMRGKSAARCIFARSKCKPRFTLPARCKVDLLPRHNPSNRPCDQNPSHDGEGDPEDAFGKQAAQNRPSAIACCTASDGSLIGGTFGMTMHRSTLSSSTNDQA